MTTSTHPTSAKRSPRVLRARARAAVSLGQGKLVVHPSRVYELAGVPVPLNATDTLQRGVKPLYSRAS